MSTFPDHSIRFVRRVGASSPCFTFLPVGFALLESSCEIRLVDDVRQVQRLSAFAVVVRTLFSTPIKPSTEDFLLLSYVIGYSIRY